MKETPTKHLIWTMLDLFHDLYPLYLYEWLDDRFGYMTPLDEE